MNKAENTLPVVYDAIRYYRYRGAGLDSVDAYSSARVDEYSKRRRSDALAKLEADGRIEKRGSKWFLSPPVHKAVRGSCYAPEFEDFDMVLLMAIVGPEGPHDLSETIGTVDFIHRTIPSYQEIYEGLNRLHAARLISVKKGRFAATATSAELWQRVKLCGKRAMYDQLDALTGIVRCPCCGPTLKRVNWQVRISDDDYQQAVKAYRKRFWNQKS